MGTVWAIILSCFALVPLYAPFYAVKTLFEWLFGLL